MASATFRMGTGPATIGPWSYGSYGACVDATAGQYVRVELQSTSGVNSIEIAVSSSDENWIATLPVVTIDQSTKTGYFRVPAAITLFEGATFAVRVRINGGVDSSDSTTAAFESRLLVHVLTGTQSRLLSVGETTELSTSAGHISKLNDLIRQSIPQARHFSVVNTGSTAGAVTADLVTIDYPTSGADEGAVTALAKVTAIVVPITGCAGFVVAATARFTTAGGWVLAAGSPDVVAAATDLGACSATFVAGGGSQLILRATGAAGSTIHWSAVVDYTVM